MGLRRRAIRSPEALGLTGGARNPAEKARKRVLTLQTSSAVDRYAWRELYEEFNYYSKQFPSLNMCVCGHPKNEIDNTSGRPRVMMVHNTDPVPGDRPCQYCGCTGFELLIGGATLKGVRLVRSVRSIAGKAYRTGRLPLSWPRFEHKLAQAYRFMQGRPSP